ncbi:hypothetical protein Glove_744g9 [Diversispora epigaea]|uniref:Caprin-1 dimerization domain-containing protein n=1 Tax=Diversispora epigaea TaxID=1348612 RepID=A0A397FZQ2_9GLOM|nr:hypothetical protein Glove_744g9 [Diversispora epigaea]
MPNATTIESNNVQPVKRSKNKRKSLAVATNDVSPSGGQEQPSPTVVTTESAETNLENVNKNPFIEVVNKRIRTLRKKMTRIEKCEEDLKDGKTLNSDQIQSCERKNEIAGALKECEEIAKQYETVEKEEIKNQKILKKEQQEEREQVISGAVEEAEATHRQSVLSLIKFFHLVQLRLSGDVQLKETESESIDSLHNLFMSITEDTKDDQVNKQRILECTVHLNKLSNGDENVVPKSFANGAVESNNETAASSPEISYSHIRNLIENPPILNTVEPTEQENSVVEREVIINQEEMVNHDDGLGGAYTTIPAGGLQFMLPRDESTSQTLDPMINQNHVSYVYSGADSDKSLATTESMTENNIKEYQQQQQQQQSFSETYLEQQQQSQEYTLDQQQYVSEQQQQQNFITEQSEQNQLSVDQQDKLQEPKPIIDLVQIDVQQQQTQTQPPSQLHPQQPSQQPPTQTSQQMDQPPPLSYQTGNHRGGYRGGHRGPRGGGYRGGQGRRDSGGYYYREGGNYRGNRGNNAGPRNNRGGNGGGSAGGSIGGTGGGSGYQGPRGGNQYKQRSQ